MEHNRATETHAVERYLLGEMPPEERDDFEEHYFGCTVCAQEVRHGARFRANAREVLGAPEQFAAEKRAKWWQFPSFLPVAASFLVLGALIGYEAPQLKQREAVQLVASGAPVFQLRDAARGLEGAKGTRIPHGSGPVSLNFEVISDERTASYDCTIADSSGKTFAVTKVEAPQGQESLSLQIQRDYFPAGHYSISVRTTQGKDKVKFEFEIV